MWQPALNELVRAWEGVAAFLELGGTALVALLGVTLLMWSLIIERLWYVRWVHPQLVRAQLSRWPTHSLSSSWSARRIRQWQISEIRQGLEGSLPLIKTLVTVCPLIGLLGTVSGMVEVFDVMAIAGNGNPRAMASGVSRATIPTMASMVAALSGIFSGVRLDRLVQAELLRFEEVLGKEGAVNASS